MKPIFGPDGQPIMLVGTEAEQLEQRTKAILIECFGVLAGFQQKFEWPKLDGGIDAGGLRLMDAIVDRVGREPIYERFKMYGLAFENAEDPNAPPTEPVPPPPDQPRGHRNPANPYRVIKGGRR
jgi:hypothetical protein